MRLLAFAFAGALGLSLTGCFGEGDAKVPGDDLGKFQVIGRLESSTCGVGALGSQDVWEFELRLSRAPQAIYWLNGREVVPGEIADDGVSFEVEALLEVKVLDPEPGYPGCVLERRDRASGQLSSATTEVESFDGRLSYGYRGLPDSDCSPLFGVSGGVDTLPCGLSYALEATRIESPEELRPQR